MHALGVPYDLRPEAKSLPRCGDDVHVLLSATLRKSATFALYDAVLRERASDSLFLPFECLEGERDRLSELFEVFEQTANFRSIMVSDPFKFVASAKAGELTPRARDSGAVNLLFKRDGQIIGDNLDGIAFRNAMQYAGVELRDKTMLFFGCGGVSTAVALEFADDLAMVGLCDIDEARRSSLRTRLAHLRPNLPVKELPVGEPRDCTEYEVLYNGTGLGKSPRTLESPLNVADKIVAGVYLDAVYAPPETPFLQRGKAEGALWVNGRGHMMGSTALHCSYILGLPVSLDEVRLIERRLPGRSRNDGVRRR